MDLIRTKGVQLKENAGPLKRKIWLTYLGNTIIMESCLSSSIESETCTNGILIFFTAVGFFLFDILLEWSFL